jgi:ADP-ribosylglycohydrolase
MINKLSFKGYSLTKENETAPVKTQNNITFNSDMQKLKDNPNSYYNRIMFTGVSKVHHNAEKHKLQNYKACLIGGAIGDALGYPVEFSRLNRIKDTYGSNGITNLKLDKGQAIITDDTQMTMFTADGLLKSALTSFDETKIPDMKIIYNSYQDWLKTQGYGSLKPTSKGGWISKLDELQVRRAPGNTCIGSLVTGIPGSIERPTNDSEGCGGVMRVAPVGLMYYKNPKLAFEVGARCAALTHGSPNAYLAAGIHSCIIANLVNGKNIRKAVDNSIEVLKTYQGSEKIQGLMAQAKKMQILISILKTP